MGEDANQFSGLGDNDNTNNARVEDDDNDLLGGGDDSVPTAAPSGGAMGDMGDFESSFPSIDTQNEVLVSAS